MGMMGGRGGGLCLGQCISNELPPGGANAAGGQPEEHGSRVRNLTFLSFSFFRGRQGHWHSLYRRTNDSI